MDGERAMRRIGIWSLAACAVIFLGVVMSSAARTAGAEEEIRALLDGQVASWNKGNLDEFADAYWKSPNLVFMSAAERTSGWEAMRERYRKRYQGEGKEMGKLDFRELDVVVLAPDAGFARGRWRLKLANGTEPGGLFTVILRKLPEGWRIIHDHTSG